MKLLQKKKCKSSDFKMDEGLYNIINNLTINKLKIDDFYCLEKDENKIEGIYTSSIFNYYKITISVKKEIKNYTNYSEINDFLFKNDCKLQFYYIDYSIDIKNYKNPFKPLLNSIFLQLNPDFYIKKNVFFMNYHFKADDRLFHIFQSEEDEKEMKNISFSRIEDYFFYKRGNSSSNITGNGKFASLFIRADNKKTEIKRENQNLLDFYAQNSAFWVSLFEVLNFFFTIYNEFHANRSLASKLFFFEEKENNKFNILKRRNSSASNVSLINAINVNNLNELTMNDSEGKDNKNNELNTMPIVFVPKIINNFIAPSDKDLNRNETNINTKKEKKEKQIEKKIEEEKEDKKNKNRYSIFSLISSLFKIFFCCCKNKLNFKEQLIIKSMDIFDKKLDIYIYIKNMIFIDIMIKVLMSEIDKDCINFLSRSLIYLDKNKKEEEEELNNFYKPTTKFDKDNSNRLISEFKNLMEKKEKTEIEKKIISLYIDN